MNKFERKDGKYYLNDAEIKLFSFEIKQQVDSAPQLIIELPIYPSENLKSKGNYDNGVM